MIILKYEFPILPLSEFHVDIVGFASFVGPEAHHGSVYIKHLIEVFSERAHGEDINTLLTLVR